MIDRRRPQRSFGEGLIAEEVGELWEDWMRHADRVLDDPQLVNTVYEALVQRRPKSRTRGRLGTPADIVLRLLVLKHTRDWSFQCLEREVRANLVYRDFTRVGAGKVPDAKSIARQAQAVGPQVVQDLQARVVALAQEQKLVQGRKMRVDTTVVETNIHYPTDSSLLGDGIRVLTRLMKKVRERVGEVGTKLRNRSRSAQRWVVAIARSSRSKSACSQEKMKEQYQKLLAVTGRVVGQAKRFAAEIVQGVKCCSDVLQQAAVEGMGKELERMTALVQRVVRQAKARVFGGDTHVEGKLVSLFEPSTEIIRKGKTSKPTEFGKMIQVQEAENQIIIDYQVFQNRPSDSALLIPAIEVHQQRLGRLPHLVAADAGYYSAHGETAAHDRGVKRVSIPNRSTKSAERKRHQKQRWFRNGQKWRTGSEGRISVLKRRHGLNRCRYKGDRGMQRWVGLGVMADNLINIGRALARPGSG